MQTAPLATRSFACSGSGARCRYVNRICPSRSIARSTACGSLTLTIMSAAANTSAAVATTVAPGLAVGVVVHADALPRVALDDDLVAVRDDLAHAAGRQADAVLEDLDFLRDADAHGNDSGKWQGRGDLAREAAPESARASRSSPAKVYDWRVDPSTTRPPRRPPADARGRPDGDHHGPRRTDDPRPDRDEADLARRVLDAVHAQPRIQGGPADGRPRGRDVPVERPRRQDHRRLVGPVLRFRRARPQGDRRGRRQAAARARLLRAVPARAPEAIRARDARRRAHARRSQPDLLLQFRLRVGRHRDEGRARVPPGARPGRTQRLRLARARLPRRQLRRRRRCRGSSTTGASTGRGCRASPTCGTRT